MSGQEQLRARYRFDPHDEGIWLGLGLGRLSMVCGSMLLGALCVYGGRILPALLLLLVVPPLVLARWDGLPLLTWLPLRLLYRLQGPTVWAIDPEHAGFVTPLTTWVPPIAEDPENACDVEALAEPSDAPIWDDTDHEDEDDLWHS